MSCEILILNLPHEESQWGSIITYGACISVCEKAQQWQQPGIAILILVFWKREWQMLVNAGESRQHNRIILPQWVFWLHAHAWFAVSSTRKVDDCLSLDDSLTGGTDMNWECREFSNKACYVLVERAARTKVTTERHCIQCSHHSVTWCHYKKASKLKDEMMRQHPDVRFSYFPFGINKFGHIISKLRCSAATLWHHVLRIFEALCRGEGPTVKRE